MLEFLAWAFSELFLGINLVSYKSPLDFTPKFGSSFGEGIESYGWRCQYCGKRCYKPGERPENLTRSEWTANILPVHHRDLNYSDNCSNN